MLGFFVYYYLLRAYFTKYSKLFMYVSIRLYLSEYSGLSNARIKYGSQVDPA